MTTIDLSARDLADIVWRRWALEFSWDLAARLKLLADLGARLDADTARMSVAAGSISFGTAVGLYLLARKFARTTVFEVGTYIGRSTAALALGMGDARVSGGRVYTCDLSNDFVMDTGPYGVEIVPAPRTGSTAALQRAVDDRRAVDLFHLDGRLAPADPDLMARLAHPGTIIALDDFEGIEKGVANAVQLRQSAAFAGHVLIHPPPQAVLAALGVASGSNTALLVPPGLFRITAQ
jgi:predicted O-methyltransferase YrrM